MQYTLLGKTGITVSRICLGCMSYGGGDLPDWALGTKGWHVNKEDAREHFKIAIDSGINFFDTADVYSAGLSEEITGEYLREMASRDEIIVATKVCGAMGKSPNKKGLSRKHIIEGCENSLRRLGMDFIDLYQIHRWDFNTPIEETLDALDSLVRAGKVRYLGASSMAAWQFSKALYLAKEHGWHRFIAMQNHYNLVYREEEREMIPLCIDQGVGVIPWSPLARGFLTGNAASRGRIHGAIASGHLCQRHVLQRRRFSGGGRGGSGRQAARSFSRPSSLRLGAAGAGSDCADYRSHQNPTPERSHRIGGFESERR